MFGLTHALRLLVESIQSTFIFGKVLCSSKVRHHLIVRRNELNTDPWRLASK